MKLFDLFNSYLLSNFSENMPIQMIKIVVVRLDLVSSKYELECLLGGGIVLTLHHHRHARC